MSKPRLFLLFGTLQILFCLVVFRDALWGNSLLAPLDIAPALFSKYRYMDPASTGVPANHHPIDQLTFDLPVQYSMYHAWHEGEIPWWDPYTYGGWAQMQDAHSNGTDFTRLLMYALLPFEAAYNWTRIAHFILCGLGMFLLLRRLGFRDVTCLGLSAAYEYSGSLSLFFEHPWIQSSFVYYPFLWLAWDGAFKRGGWRYPLGAALAVAGILYSGSIQTHVYLLLFSAGFGLGYAGWCWRDWKRIAVPIVVSGLMGACLAAPVWLGQMELFFLGQRNVDIATSKWSFLCGIGSLSALYPWGLGSFRTFDLGKFLGQKFVGFHTFVGSIAFLLALCGIWMRRGEASPAPARRTALAMVVLYLVVLSTPLLHVFYLRCAALAVMGLIVLAAYGLEWLQDDRAPRRRAAAALGTLAVILAAVVHLGAFVIYPRQLPRITEFVMKRDANNPTLDAAPALRQFQLKNLPHAVSFLNPAALLCWLGMVAFAALLWRPSWRLRTATWTGMLALNVVPVLWVARDYVPCQPIGLWQALLQGGPEQQRVAARLADTSLRLSEKVPGVHEMVMPLAFPLFYRVRCLHGYSSLRPPCVLNLPPSERDQWFPHKMDWTYESTARGLSAGSFYSNAPPLMARFQWNGPAPRNFTVEDRGLCEVHVRFDPGPAGQLLWTDTRYPGWQALADGRGVSFTKEPPYFSRIEVPAGAKVIVLRYRPRFLSAGLGAAAVGSLLCLGLAMLALREHRACPPCTTRRLNAPPEKRSKDQCNA